MSPRSTRRFSIEVVDKADAATAKIDGDLDRSTVGALRDTGLELVGKCSHVSVDLVAASVIDSAALGVLIELRRSADDHECGFDIVIGPKYQRALFDVTGLSDYFDLIQVP